jgi:hypothetical protein
LPKLIARQGNRLAQNAWIVLIDITGVKRHPAFGNSVFVRGHIQQALVSRNSPVFTRIVRPMRTSVSGMVLEWSPGLRAHINC